MMSREVARRWAGVLVAVVCLSLACCRAAQVAEPLTGELAGNDPETQMAFWYTLAERPVVSNDEAFHGLLLFLDGVDESEDYAGRVATLKSRGMLPNGFDARANEGVRRGDLAVAILKMLEIRGGVVLSVFGPSPRYATRELEYMRIYPQSSPNQTFTGGQFMALVGRLEDMERLRGIEREVAAPPAEPQDEAEAEG